MRYGLLGKSGLRVSELCLGAMTFGEAWQEMRIAAPHEECRRIFETFAAAGGNFIDTANHYNFGASEEFLGEFVRPDRERFVLATKYSLTMRRDDPNAGGNHRKNLMQSLDGSLRRLKTDYIDLYWIHAWDFTTPVDEVMRALDDAVRAGKVLHVGISDVPAWVVARANTLAELRGWTAFVGLQVQYSLVERAVERDLLPMASDFGMSVTAWSPLGMGILTGKYGRNREGQREAGRLDGSDHPHVVGYRRERNVAIVAEVEKIAGELGRTPSQVALSWLRHKGVIPILGARTVGQVTENLACVDLDLTSEHVTRLDDVSRIELGFPHDFIEGQTMRDLIFGDSLPRVDSHALPGRAKSQTTHTIG